MILGLLRSLKLDLSSQNPISQPARLKRSLFSAPVKMLSAFLVLSCLLMGFNLV